MFVIFGVDYKRIAFTGIASFAPKEKGTYQCNVHRASDEKHIRSSPFSITVGDTELAHAAKVSVSGDTTSAKANTPNHVLIDTNGAGIYAIIVVRTDSKDIIFLCLRFAINLSTYSNLR